MHINVCTGMSETPWARPILEINLLAQHFCYYETNCFMMALRNYSRDMYLIQKYTQKHKISKGFMNYFKAKINILIFINSQIMFLNNLSPSSQTQTERYCLAKALFFFFFPDQICEAYHQITGWLRL